MNDWLSSVHHGLWYGGSLKLCSETAETLKLLKCVTAIRKPNHQRQAIKASVCVCVCVCVREHRCGSAYSSPDLFHCFVCVPAGSGAAAGVVSRRRKLHLLYVMLEEQHASNGFGSLDLFPLRGREMTHLALLCGHWPQDVGRQTEFKLRTKEMKKELTFKWVESDSSCRISY